jgi:hypothetical protein
MAINETITLQGVPQVKEQLAQVTQASQQTSAAINSIGTEGGGAAPIQNVFVQLKNGTQTLKETTGATNELRLATGILKPALGELGASMGNMREFSRLAGESLLGLAAALTGAAIINLTKFNEQLTITQKNLDTLSHGPGAFQQMASDASRLGISIQTLSPAVTAMVKAFQTIGATSTVKFIGDVPPASIQNLQTAAKFADALIADLKAAGVSAPEATKAVTEFANQLGKTGTITGDMIRKIQDVSPVAAEALKNLFDPSVTVEKFAAQLDKAPISLQKLATVINSTKFAEFADPKPITDLTGKVDQLGAKFEELKTKIAPAAAEIGLLGVNLATSLADLSEKIGPSVAAVLSRFSGFDLVKQIIEGTDWGALSEKFASEFDKVKALATTMWSDVVAIFNNPEGIDLQGLVQSFNNIFQSILQAAQSFWQQLQQTLSQQLQGPEVINPLGNIPFSGGGFASGGIVRGPGTATSDSILARVSSGEFILNAAATSHWGVQFLAALNRMQMPMLMSQSTLVPRFAEGGPVTTPAVVNLHFGGESFALQASEGVAQALRKHAVRSRLVSTGRKPSWY